MLNMNSPTVQAMLNNLPQGVGNMPVYYGNTPTITNQTYPQISTPYPSPKEMLTQAGQNNIYAPTSFISNNIVGGYNPGYQSAFADYNNPYMGYGAYGGYTMMAPMDDDARQRLETAMSNGLTYDEQLVNESNLYKSLSKIVSKNIGRDEDTAKECASTFDIYCKYPQTEQINRKPIKPIHIQLKIGDTVVADMKSRDVNIRNNNYIRNSNYVEEMKVRDTVRRNNILNNQIQLHNSALERQFDNMDLLTFFNNGAGILMTDSLNRQLQSQLTTNSSQMYDRQAFRQRVLANNGLRPKSEMKAVDRFIGRYGIMPDGRPVSPGHDPAVATSFSYDPKTGQYSVTAPNFISNRLEQARQSFIRSIDDN